MRYREKAWKNYISHSHHRKKHIAMQTYFFLFGEQSGISRGCQGECSSTVFPEDSNLYAFGWFPTCTCQNLQYCCMGFLGEKRTDLQLMNLTIGHSDNGYWLHVQWNLTSPLQQGSCIKPCWSLSPGICMWVRAMETYDRVAKVVGPKKEALAIAEAEYAEVPFFGEQIGNLDGCIKWGWSLHEEFDGCCTSWVNTVKAFVLLTSSLIFWGSESCRLLAATTGAALEGHGKAEPKAGRVAKGQGFFVRCFLDDSVKAKAEYHHRTKKSNRFFV